MSFTGATNTNLSVSTSRKSLLTVGPLRLLLNAIGTSLTKIANAPLRFSELRIDHSFVQSNTLASRLASHYHSEALRQAYIILGSVDVLGNPLVAWNNLRRGFQHFLWEPIEGFNVQVSASTLLLPNNRYDVIVVGMGRIHRWPWSRNIGVESSFSVHIF